MFAFLKGVVHGKEISGGPVDRLVLDVAGVGYELAVAHNTLLTIGQFGDDVTVHVSLAVRETEWTLFGFGSQQERQIFLLLQSVSGIGPRLALALVGTLGVDTLVEAILSENQKMISQAPGVGAKVAQRIILEIKGKIKDFAATRGQSVTAVPVTAAADEVTEILQHYGYTATEIHDALKQAQAGNVEASAEELLRFTLKILGARAVK